MSDINWKDGAVCHANGMQHIVSGFLDDDLLSHCLTFKDFQLNEIRTGDFIPASELDTEQKYNEVVEVFGLFGFPPYLNHNLDMAGFCSHGMDSNTGLIIHEGNSQLDYGERLFDVPRRKRQLTYHQTIAIGKLKRMMLEREKSKLIENASMMKQLRNNELAGATKFNPDTMQIKDDGSVVAKPKRRNKSKQAYDILKSLDYEYDLVKQKWFRKEYID